MILQKGTLTRTAFTTLTRLYEWNVMPFGLKNAPSVYQRKMDQIFNHLKKFCLVYVDDILIHSKSRKEHYSHLKMFFAAVDRHKVLISKKKLELYKPRIAFLGSEIGKGTIILQSHISKKILEFPNKIEETKKLQSFLGLVNYARIYIKNLSQLLGPLWAKLSKTGQKRFNKQDELLVQQIKDKC